MRTSLALDRPARKISGEPDKSLRGPRNRVASSSVVRVRKIARVESSADGEGRAHAPRKTRSARKMRKLFVTSDWQNAIDAFCLELSVAGQSRDTRRLRR